ncbi:unnamed protein product [Microthlaspi erraticum]|uniref:Uncharacterized protein n=1 Tax=Microthlaspi erraticum TaxID=1685480 RepID=A0A6D2L578_9BRAS|nr:unnamed protein product [Microthlaspi erraticum]
MSVWESDFTQRFVRSLVRAWMRASRIASASAICNRLSKPHPKDLLALAPLIRYSHRPANPSVIELLKYCLSIDPFWISELHPRFFLINLDLDLRHLHAHEAFDEMSEPADPEIYCSSLRD